jgi:hypothetical protein
MLCTMVGSSGRRGKLPLPSPCDETKLIRAGADSASTVSTHSVLCKMTIDRIESDVASPFFTCARAFFDLSVDSWPSTL